MNSLSIGAILLLAMVQGLAELLPVSSSAHVIVVQKILGLDPSSPELTFLLVMLHTGTMFATLVYFWKRWLGWLTGPRRGEFIRSVAIATVVTGVVGYGLKILIEKIFMAGHEKAEVELLFKNLPLIACALFAVGVLILWASRYEDRAQRTQLDDGSSLWIGLIQGLCLPFRGFSRSGATISVALWKGLSKSIAEEYSFALAVVLTPAVIGHSALRLIKALKHSGQEVGVAHFTPGLIGMVFAFGAGVVALKWLSSWLENGKWKFFGIYCLCFSAVVLAVHFTLH